jgi:hypothetical protein
MRHARTPTIASYAAFGGGRLARVLPHVLRVAAAGVFALVSASPALAQRYHDRGDPRIQDQRVQQDPRAVDPRAVDPRAIDPRAADPRALPPQREQRFDPRTFDSREVEDRRRQEQGARDIHRSGRLTPDERRDLRRQINEAGMDLYSHPPRH